MKNSRRQFMKQTALFVASVPCLSLLTQVRGTGWVSEAFAAKSKAPAPLPAGQTAVPESDPVASALGYKQNAKDVDFTKYPDRKKPEAKNQFCNNCALYTSVNESWGKCQMITAGLVAANGWCGSWSKKS